MLLLTFRSLAAIVSEKSTVFTFSYRKASVNKFDHAVKLVKVTPGSSFEQTMMGWSTQCYIPSFMKIGLPVLEKKIFEGFYHIWAWRPSWSCDQDRVKKKFISLYLKAFIQNLVQNGPVVSEKILFEFLYVHDLGPRSSNDLDLQYSHTFMK